MLAVTVKVGPLTAGNETAATVAPYRQSTVAAQVAGVVLHVVHLAGDWVKEGEPVVVLDTSQLKLAVATAQAALDNAKINYQVGQDNANTDNPKLTLQLQSAQSALDSAQKNYDSQKALFDIGGAPSSAVDTAKSQLQQAQANLQAAQTSLEQNKKSDIWTLQQLRLAIDQAQLQLQTAQLNLQYASIKAPYAGQIAAVNVNPGMYVSQNTAVYVIVSSEKEIIFNVPPADAPNLPVGTTVQFTYLGHAYPVKVSQAPSAPINGVIPMVTDVPRSFSLPYGAVGTASLLAHGRAGAHRADRRAPDERRPELRVRHRERQGSHPECHHTRPVRDERGSRRCGRRGAGHHECSAGAARGLAVQVHGQPHGPGRAGGTRDGRASPNGRSRPRPTAPAVAQGSGGVPPVKP